MKPPQDIPGNAIGSAAQHARFVMRYGTALLLLDEQIERLSEADVWVTSLSIRVPHHIGGEVLLVCRAEHGGSKMVCFHASDTVAEVLRGFINRVMNESLVWKEDAYGN